MDDEAKKERTFPTLELTPTGATSPEIQSPKTPTLSRKLKAVSLDSEPPKQSTSLEVSRDVFSMPNTPKRQAKHKLEFDNKPVTLTPNFSSNLKKFASNNSISGSQTLKTLPEIMTLQDFSDGRTSEPVRVKTRGLLERRGSNASLTIDLGSNSSIAEKTTTFMRLNSAKSVSNLNLSTFGDRCACAKSERRKSQEACGNCIIYESVPSKANGCKTNKCGAIAKRCNCRRKSLSNENLYVPPCGFCQGAATKHCKGYRKAYYPRQPDVDSSQLLSEDFKMHLENVQYLQTAGSVLSITDLKMACEVSRVPKLHSEFWEVPLNLQEKCYVSGSQSRNRYKGVLPNEHSRVHLPGPQSYIHANYIKGPDYTETAYIATQGPMAHTCLDFWDMIWHTNCVRIVMLTGLVEKGRSKCELYFPLGKKDQSASKSFYYVTTIRERDQTEEEIFKFEELNQVDYVPYSIKYIKKENLDECVIRHLEIIHTNKNESRTIRHYWLPNWQDHKMANPEQLLKMALHLLNDNKTETVKTEKPKLKPIRRERRRSSDSGPKAPPVVVHCSAGIGRTGCFLAILNGIQQLKTNLNVDVLAILCSLRLNRGGMVQTAEQYELIHRVLNLYVDTM
ncbi:uncharacterized protein LOC656520 [Tribolium castaneum]|uniref:protein-tyrosine-phosphatase n=1 Tax=Tribolium castaneum TaxID=7070 RepID=D2A4J3_TRICA|nr:PREDICTED: uncharacterized protein LOC656520 [Tribolium castaneum]EFA05231.1 Tyrosine-protein phosphatase non-receptor type 7-like Protein [Tribolium castaneum]|eukprot:XP_008194464.1 PREDICTED: uncharacterized protein LOC656520 [Tribolium castaneum]